MRFPKIYLGRLSVAAAVALSLAAVVLVEWRGPIRAEDRQQQQGVAQANTLSKAFRAAAQQVIPTVVLIKTTTKPQRSNDETPRGRSRGRNPFKGTPFEDFFDDDMPGFHSQPFIQQGVGSGVVVDPSGIILTNNHVVEGADEVLIELPDGREFKASETKVDEQTDLAILRIKIDEKLPYARLGDSSKMEIGDWVLAIGNPFELEHTVSAGIISGSKRVLPSGKRAEYLQTDAAINPGNSGGPLVNLDGEVVGINTAIASSSGGYQGIGFAIPSNLAKWVMQQLIEHGKVERAYLGVGIVDITNDLAAKLGVRPHEGVLVTEIFPDTPAGAAGVQEGDVIKTFAGQKVSSPHELQELVERSKFGSKQELQILRNKQSLALQVEVKSMPTKFGVARSKPKQIERGDRSAVSDRALGLELSDVTSDVAQQLGLKGSEGALIVNVREGGLAADAGLRPGMVILKVGQKSIKSAADFETAMKHESVKEGVMLLVRTASGNRFIVLQQH